MPSSPSLTPVSNGIVRCNTVPAPASNNLSVHFLAATAVITLTKGDTTLEMVIGGWQGWQHRPGGGQERIS